MGWIANRTRNERDRRAAASPHETRGMQMLESRRLLAVDVGIVQLSQSWYFGEWESFIEVSEWSNDGHTLRRTTGQQHHVRPMIFRDEGYVQFDYAEWGFGGYGHQDVGAQFLPEHGFAAGWWAGEYFGAQDEGTYRHAQLIVPLAAPGTGIGVLAGEWTFSTWTVARSIDAPSIGDAAVSGEGAAGSFTIDTIAGRIDWSAVVGDAPATTSTISGWDGNSFITTGAMSFMLSADGQTLVFAETGHADSTTMIGVATRVAPAPTMEEVAGTYLGFLRAVETPIEQLGPFIEVPLEMKLSLSADGSYRISGADSLYNSGESGTWSVSGSSVVLVADGGAIERRSTIGANGGELIGESVTENGDTVGVFGFATRRVTSEGVPHDPVVTLPWLDENDDPIVLIDRTNESWRVAEVSALSGGPEVIGEIVTWFDPITREAHAAGVSAQGVVVYREIAPGTWSYRVMASGTGDDPVVTRGLSITVAAGHQVNIFGLTDDGELIRYFTRPRAATEINWSMQNLSATELPRTDSQTPAYQGKLAAYVTGWGGLNVAGLDAEGRVWTVWWAPGSGGWHSSNISMLTRSARFSGPIDVTVTPWRGINITGVNILGEVVTNWWTPGMGDMWSKSNLTRGTDLETLAESQFSAVYRPRDASIGFIGLDRDTGGLVMYWWQKPRYPSEDYWRTTDIMERARADESMRIIEGLVAEVTPEGDLNVFGRAADGRMVRYWTPNATDSGAWYVEFIDL